MGCGAALALPAFLLAATVGPVLRWSVERRLDLDARSFVAGYIAVGLPRAPEPTALAAAARRFEVER